MKNILLLNKIAKVGLDKLDTAKYNIGENVDAPEGILVRSASMHDMAVPASLLAVARAGAGVNNIPTEEYAKKGIVVFNTPGANANGVKELAICALMLASRDIVGGVEWAKTLDADAAKAVEKGKGKFAGCEIKGKTLGVIGLGAIGGMVANAAVKLGMNVIGCDPYLSVEGAWNLDHHIVKAASYDEIYREADYITLHVPATPQTKNMISSVSIDTMKDGVRIINLARADLVCAEDLKEALGSGKVASYVTDFPTEEIIGVPGIVAIPHLGASTEESENNCAVMAALELDDYLENGNIKNSVHYPAVFAARKNHRITILAEDNPAVSSLIADFADKNDGKVTCSGKNGNIYAIIDSDKEFSSDSVAKLAAAREVYRVREII